VSAFPWQVFVDPVQANQWAKQQRILAESMRMRALDYGNRMVVRVPMVDAKGLHQETVVDVDPIITLGDRLDQDLADSVRLFDWRQDMNWPVTIGYRRCLVIE